MRRGISRGKIRNKLRALDILPKDIDELWDILDDGKGELLVMKVSLTL